MSQSQYTDLCQLYQLIYCVYYNMINDIEKRRAIGLLKEVYEKYPQCSSADDAIWTLLKYYHSQYLDCKSATVGIDYLVKEIDYRNITELFGKLKTYYPSSPYIKSFEELVEELKK